MDMGKIGAEDFEVLQMTSRQQDDHVFLTPIAVPTFLSVDNDFYVGQPWEPDKSCRDRTIDTATKLQSEMSDSRNPSTQNIEACRSELTMSNSELSHVGTLVSNEAHLSTNEPHLGVHDTDKVSMVVKCGRVGVVSVGGEWAGLPKDDSASLGPLLADLRGYDKGGPVQLIADRSKELGNGQWVHLMEDDM
jgi:hypothetical protein